MTISTISTHEGHYEPTDQHSPSQKGPRNATTLPPKRRARQKAIRAMDAADYQDAPVRLIETTLECLPKRSESTSANCEVDNETMDQADQKRIAGRKWAEDAIDYAMGDGKDFLDGFRRQLKRAFAGDLTPADTMNEQEAIAFEAETIAFGKHAGSEWGQVPADYIGWLADQGLRLQRYVRSDRYRGRET